MLTAPRLNPRDMLTFCFVNVRLLWFLDLFMPTFGQHCAFQFVNWLCLILMTTIKSFRFADNNPSVHTSPTSFAEVCCPAIIVRLSIIYHTRRNHGVGNPQ